MTRTVADMIEAVEEVAAPTGGHGAGFWDRSWPTLPGFPEAGPATIDAGEELTAAAHLEGEAELEPDGAGRLTYRQ